MYVRPPQQTPLFLAFAVLVACGDSSATTETDATTDATSDSDGSEGGTDQNDRDLGDSASAECEAAMIALPGFVAAAGDASAMTSAYQGALQELVRRFDSESGRSDDADVVTALADGSPEALVDAEIAVYRGIVEALRSYVGAPEGGAEDPYTPWDDAHCLWSGALQERAVAAEGWTGEDIVGPVDAAFQAGHDGFVGEPPAGLDEWMVYPAKQVTEKSQYRVIHRHVIHYATLARDDVDALAARRALRWFEVFSHRLEGRNDAGITVITDMLSGDPAAIDPAVIVRELNVAFAMRTRGYASASLDAGELGVPNGYKAASEGEIYNTLLYPDMTAQLPGFAQASHEQLWADYKQGLRDDDFAAAEAASDALVEALCSYQVDVLGLAECKSGSD
ncbi:MAG: hypothetical protein KC636_23085 [Myxococcales bacterium]|nr:hypothetical protein [Myxococcales bacterium]